MNKNIYNTANFFWEGKFSIYEKLSISSFLENGFFVNLWTYSTENFIENEKLEVKNANLIMSKKDLSLFTQNFQKKNLSSFSNLFRYKILDQFGGWWFDTDCICIKEVEHFENLAKSKQFVIGLVDKYSVNGSVMFFNDEKHMNQLVTFVEEKLKNKDINFKWGEIGPTLLTNYLKENNLMEFAVPKNFFYEVSANNFHLFFSKKSKKDLNLRLKNSYVSHLWNEMYRRYLIDKNKLPPRQSLIFDWFNKYGYSSTNFKIYSNLFNLRFKFPFYIIFKIISRIKIIFKNLNSSF